MNTKFFIPLIFFSYLLSPITLEGKKITNSRIRMVDGDYAKLSDFHSNGPLIINFWTTW